MVDSILSFVRFVFKYKNGLVDKIMFYVSMICAAIVIFNVGYVTDPTLGTLLGKTIHYLFFVLFFMIALRESSSIYALRKIAVEHYSGLFILIYFIFILIARFAGIDALSVFSREQWIYLGIYIIFIAELSKSTLFFDNFYFNPTILFVISFLVLILIGTVLLMLPRTTIEAPLSFVDALFMATSAVCITGLSVADISTNFSMFGQTVIIVLIQVGGLGIMTFTGFFGYFFSGGFSFKNQLMFGEILGENKVASVIKTLLTMIFITLLFEFLGALLIFSTLESANFPNMGSMIFFSIFHSISSFCNAGFSILSGGITNDAYKFNYPFQLALSSLFILGGLGFGIVLNFYTYIKESIFLWYHRLVTKKKYKHKAWSFSFNSKLVLLCNAIIIVSATLFFYFLERKNTLSLEKGLDGEWATSFFMANAARSAGYNSIDLSFVGAPTIFLIMLLMWIGASPGSTGGGVKVTTVALSFINIISLAKGKEYIEIFKRRIAGESVNKAFAIILLSFIVVGLSFFALIFTDPDKSMKDLLFESLSAYTTCGLSLGITPSLSMGGKLIIVVTMLVGRVGMLTLLVAFIKNTTRRNIIFPEEKILF
ncbi:TrkH family potassium uptake protein [Sphingobacterium detergens]|uniref:Trk-type K+ transport system membrane component n=1 Tax=Sphingobacterium detergens TaxID=1145106 RepID=A0A420AYT8_SPHD1|nr:potassium transporter TrkG [Sphingobacterium detergens]RKE49694.1 Trk-type K+ transport system membrane component [Sphingobacterium detergens]